MGDLSGAPRASSGSHYQDWPNAVGFDTHYEERRPVELQVTGTIPAYAAGTLFRTGLGPRTIHTRGDRDFVVNHWFDNFSQVHRFQIHAPDPAGGPVRVTYNSRLTSDGLIEKIRATGQLDDFTFAAKYEPCKSLFRKVQAVFRPAPAPQAPNEISAAVTMSVNFPGLTGTGEKRAGPGDASAKLTLCNKTDTNVFQMLDPETLEPVGIAEQRTLHPALKGPGSGAHAKSDPRTGDVFNYNLEFGRTGTYRLFRVAAATGTTSILATVRHAPAYLHSLFLTEHYVVLCVWNSFYKAGGARILWDRNLLDAMSWDASQPTRWFVVDKRPADEGGQGLVATYTSDPFFCFHTINAYEVTSSTANGAVDIVADLSAYENMDVLHRLYLDNLISSGPPSGTPATATPSNMRATYRRYRLPSIPSTAPATATTRAAVMKYCGDHSTGFELPIVNPRVVTQKHRFMYGTSDTGRSTFVDSLVKYDADTHQIVRWSQHGQTAGEPIFVPDPDATAEDGGVLLSVVLDGAGGKSYLLVLDAATMTEIGRAHVDGAIGFGFHGLFVRTQDPVGRLNGLHL